MGLVGLGASASRTVLVSLSIPAIAVLEVPERGLLGPEVKVEMQPGARTEDFLVFPLSVKSNVP